MSASLDPKELGMLALVAVGVMWLTSRHAQASNGIPINGQTTAALNPNLLQRFFTMPGNPAAGQSYVVAPPSTGAIVAAGIFSALGKYLSKPSAGGSTYTPSVNYPADTVMAPSGIMYPPMPDMGGNPDGSIGQGAPIANTPNPGTPADLANWYG